MSSDEDSIGTAVKVCCKGYLWTIAGTIDTHKPELRLKLSMREKNYRQVILNNLVLYY